MVRKNGFAGTRGADKEANLRLAACFFGFSHDLGKGSATSRSKS
jgi:hypothetical protein